ncbi:unnamed protein product [Effrenium voratum]|uniref:Uncharacterized protein n=1 Tax=Effrenium voratum TaxID=2562239 RepID=A0AA36JEI5_9DINO|nr:unnamed protein product [Effrenium voratum]
MQAMPLIEAAPQVTHRPLGLQTRQPHVARRGARELYRRGVLVVALGLFAPARSRAKPLRESRVAERKKLEDGSEVVKLASGVQYLDLRVGRGEVPQMGDTVLLHVKGYLMEKGDPIFMNTYDDGAPLVFSLGTMPEVPSYLGYANGLARAGVKPPLRLPIPFKEGLRYELELLRCVPAPQNGGDKSGRLCCSDPQYPCKIPSNIRLDVAADVAAGV